MLILCGSFRQGDELFNIDSRAKQYTGIAAAACAIFFVLDLNTSTISDTNYTVIVEIGIIKKALSLRANPSTWEQNREHLAMIDLQSWLYFNNC